MSGVDDYFPPHGYDWIWWCVLPAFLVLLAAWILIARRIARRRVLVVLDGPPVPLAPEPDPDAYAHAIERIDRIARRADEGDIAPREAHVELSAIIREYAWRRSGVDARTMTLDELRHSRLQQVASAVETFYPVAFEPTADADIQPAVERARQVVSAWS